MDDPVYQTLKDTGKLPSPSGVALELLRLVDDETATIGKITATVEADPAIASRLLKLVNSPLSGVSHRVASIAMAVSLLGMHRVKNLALGFSLLSSHRDGASKSFDYDRFWSASLARAVAARNLADHFGCCAPDEAFTIALLSRIGQLALVTAFPKDYDDLLGRTGDAAMPALLEAERKAFDIDHNALTAEMMADWRLADVFCAAVRRQDAPTPLAEGEDRRADDVARLLQLADNTASVLTGANVYREDLSGLLTTAGELGLNADAFSARFDSIKQEWRGVASIFAVRATETPSLRDVHTRAPRLHGRVLVVDDDPSVLRLIGKYLLDAGYNVLTAANGVEALRLIHTEGCQLVITDWMMPEMDGLQLCRAVRELEGVGFVYVIVLTGDTDPDSLATAFEAGADDFLTKPCKKQELLARLKAGVRTLELEAHLASQQRATHKTNAELATLNQKLQHMATTDELTGLYNRREAMSRLEELWSATERDGRPLSCMVLDIDHFKQCNDTYGHDYGDIVLRETAHVLKRNTRTGETVFRIGGEEFVVLCPGATSEMAAAGGERLRAAVEENQISQGAATLSVTVSVGVAEKSTDMSCPDDLLKLADENLYSAKRAGRNRVCANGAGASMGQGQDSGEMVDPLFALSDDWRPGGDGGKVLVVHDDAACRRALRAVLERDGLEVHEACCRDEALDKAPKIDPDVILVDVESRELGGLDLNRQLKADPVLRDTPVIAVGGKLDEEHIAAAYSAGATEYVSKPIRPREFIFRIRAMIELHQGKANLAKSNEVRGEQARAMGILFDLSRSLAAAESLDAIVAHTASATAEVASCRRVSVMLPDENAQNLYVAGAIGIDDALAGRILVPVGSAIAGRVFASGESAVVNATTGVAHCTDRYEAEFFASMPLVSRALAVPNKVVGVLNATGRHGGRPFETHEIEYLDLICNMTASAIEQFQSGQARTHAHAAIVIGLAKLAEHRDSDTGKHLERVTQFALLLATELRKTPELAEQIDDRFLRSLEQAMPLHDIGKVSVPDAVLLKPDALSGPEFAAMKRHTVVGANAIQSMIEQAPEADFLMMAKDVAHCHHEWFDGSGYPRGLRGDRIPLAARIAAVADVYDALVSKRPYKDAFPHEKAVGIIEEASGTQFDPTIVAAFLRREQDFVKLGSELADQPGADLDLQSASPKPQTQVGAL